MRFFESWAGPLHEGVAEQQPGERGAGRHHACCIPRPLCSPTVEDDRNDGSGGARDCGDGRGVKEVPSQDTRDNRDNLDTRRMHGGLAEQRDSVPGHIERRSQMRCPWRWGGGCTRLLQRSCYLGDVSSDTLAAQRTVDDIVCPVLC